MSTITTTALQVRAQLTAAGAPFEVIELDIAGTPTQVFRNAFPHLPALLNSARVHGDKEFMRYEGDVWTFTRFFAAVDALAARLQQQLGVQPGDRVAIAMRNQPEWAVAFAAVGLLGAVPAPLNSFGLHDELLDAMRTVQPRVLICDAARLAMLAADLKALDCRAIVVGAAADARGEALDFASLIAPGAPAIAPTPEPAPDDHALILFTSGAGSRAKAVLSTQRALCQGLFNIDYIGTHAAMCSPKAVAAMIARGHAPTTLTAVPLFHVSGLHAQLLASLRAGRRLVLMHRWEPERALALIAEQKITQFNGAPAMVMQLLAQPDFDSPLTASLAGLGFGGAGLPQRLIDDVLERRPNSLSGVGFGLTETNGVGAGASGELFCALPRAAGLPSPVIELRIVDLDGSALPAGESGEIWLRGVSVMQSYWNNPEATQQALSADGWFRSGDIGYLDAEGLLYVVDRIKDVINRNGEKIAAAEIESCLLQHPQVQEAAVFARPDDATGEAVVAVVVVSDPALRAEDIRAHVAQRLAAYKVPVDVHLRHEPLPRNPAGKMLKSGLKREYLAG